MIKNTFIKYTFGILLCISMLVCGATSCNSEADGDGSDKAVDSVETVEQIPMLETDHKLNENGLVDVVVLKEDIKKGQKIGGSLVKIIELPAENLPKNIISDKSLVYDKYSLRDLYKGDYIIMDWLVDDKSMIPYDHLTKTEIDCFDEDYVIVTDYVKANTGEDLYIPLQDLIDKNPGRTLYFPDGEYVISHSLYTTSNPVESTSFHLSSGATLKAADFWETDGTDRALISLGSYEKVNDIHTPGSNFFVMGGRFDGNGVADGIAIEAGRETLIKDVVIVNVRYGIHVKQGTNGASSDTDIDDVTVIGNGAFNSVGVYFAADDNTISNARISNVGTGMMLSNHTFVSSCTVENTIGARNTAGFIVGGNVHLSDCTSIDYDIGFKLTDGRGYAKQCAVLWPSGEGDEHIAFLTGKLHVFIFGCRAEFGEGEAKNIFLSADEGGNGGVVAPSFNSSLISDGDATKHYLSAGTSIIDMYK